MGTETETETTTGKPEAKLVPLTALQKERAARQAAEQLVRELTAKQQTQAADAREQVEAAMVDPEKLEALITRKAGHIVQQQESVRSVMQMMGEYEIFKGGHGPEWAEDATAAVQRGIQKLPLEATVDDIRNVIDGVARRFEARIAAGSEPDQGKDKTLPPGSGSGGGVLAAAHLKDFTPPKTIQEAGSAMDKLASAFGKAKGMLTRRPEQ